jgi:DNA-3-methyladenine glycosylase I
MTIPADAVRCRWAESNDLMRAYHDTEWGVPQHDPRMLWEMLMLEGFQAGLSWQVILNKREAFRAAFANFDPAAIAAFDASDVERLMADPGIVRARAKIHATIRGVQLYLEMGPQAFHDFCWGFAEGEPIVTDGREWLAVTPLSERISKHMKARGFKYVGPTIVYAWMQAVGIVIDHQHDCFRRYGTPAVAS